MRVSLILANLLLLFRHFGTVMSTMIEVNVAFGAPLQRGRLNGFA
jgi:hypothetical protein